MGQFFAVYKNLSGCRLLKEIHAAYGGTFAGAGGPDYNELFALVYMQVHVFENVVASKKFIYIYKFYQL